MKARWLLALAGCGPVAEETLLDELRVVSLRAEPPYVDLLAGTELQGTVFDPDGDAAVLLWTCTPGGELGCAEAGSGEAPLPVSSFAAVVTPSEGEVRLTVAPPAARSPGGPPGEVGEVDPSEPIVAGPPALAWALACAPGRCAVFDEVTSDPAPGSPAWEALVARLSDTFGLLRGLPLQGTAASTRVLDTLLVLPGVTAPRNPVVTGPPGPLTVVSGETLALRLSVDGQATTRVYPAASAGGFEQISYRVEDGAASPVLVAGEGMDDEITGLAPGTQIDVVVAVEAEDGGAAVWRSLVEVR